MAPQADLDAVAPVDLIVVRFPHAEFHGEIAGALEALVTEGTIRLLDLVLISKDDAGDVTVVELEELESTSPLAPLLQGEHDLLNADDIADVAESLEPGSAAAAVLWENAWADRLRGAMSSSGGEIVAFERIPAEAVQAAIDHARAGD
jgi:uncharacterized membrane protein